MKKKRLLSSLALLLTLALMLGGCGKMTPTKLVVKMAAAMTKTPMTSAHADAEAQLGLGSFGISLDLDLTAEADMKFKPDYTDSYSNMTFSGSALGINLSEGVQSYASVKDQVRTTYVHRDRRDTWAVRQMEQPDHAAILAALAILKEKPVSEMTLLENTTVEGGRECYDLSFEFSGEDLRNLVAYSDALQQIIGKGDVSRMSVPVHCFIDKETYLPVAAKLIFNGMNEAFSAYLKKNLNIDSETFGFHLDLATLTIDVRSVSVRFADFGYEPVDVPAVPQEGIDLAVTEN